PLEGEVGERRKTRAGWGESCITPPRQLATCSLPTLPLKRVRPKGIAMANVTPQMVKELREKTGAGMMDCKAALTETDGKIEAAVDWLRKKGLAKAAKKAGRVAAEGLVGVALAATKDATNKGVLVEVNSETDFVARNDH